MRWYSATPAGPLAVAAGLRRSADLDAPEYFRVQVDAVAHGMARLVRSRHVAFITLQKRRNLLDDLMSRSLGSGPSEWHIGATDHRVGTMSGPPTFARTRLVVPDRSKTPASSTDGPLHQNKRHDPRPSSAAGCTATSGHRASDEMGE